MSQTKAASEGHESDCLEEVCKLYVLLDGIVGLNKRELMRQLEEAFHADTLILAMDHPLRLIEQRILQATSHHKMQELCARQGESMPFHQSAEPVIGWRATPSDGGKIFLPLQQDALQALLPAGHVLGPWNVVIREADEESLFAAIASRFVVCAQAGLLVGLLRSWGCPSRLELGVPPGNRLCLQFSQWIGAMVPKSQIERTAVFHHCGLCRCAKAISWGCLAELHSRPLLRPDLF